ncbi:MAG: SDR family oxidoreductase [Desulfobacterales bacterium]|nr:SDR family oxidoreductase [Desulfobacterales bacterium]
MMKLKNKVAVVTGAGRGIGRSIALAFAREGAHVVLAARSRDQLDQVAEEIKTMGTRALAVPCDVSVAQDVQALAKVVRDEFGRLNILVNNAGISRRSKFLEYKDETWLEVILVNLFGVYLCTKALLPMIQHAGEGRIIIMASTAAKNPVPFNTAYSASKHGLLGLTKSLASELALSGYPNITVNAICPFFVNTEMFTGPQGYVAQMTKNMNLSEEEVTEKAVARNLQSRILEPEEIASLALYLASEDSRGITGQAINVCGGNVFH